MTNPKTKSGFTTADLLIVAGIFLGTMATVATADSCITNLVNSLSPTSMISSNGANFQSQAGVAPALAEKDGSMDLCKQKSENGIKAVTSRQGEGAGAGCDLSGKERTAALPAFDPVQRKRFFSRFFHI